MTTKRERGSLDTHERTQCSAPAHVLVREDRHGGLVRFRSDGRGSGTGGLGRVQRYERSTTFGPSTAGGVARGSSRDTRTRKIPNSASLTSIKRRCGNLMRTRKLSSTTAEERPAAARFACARLSLRALGMSGALPCRNASSYGIATSGCSGLALHHISPVDVRPQRLTWHASSALPVQRNAEVGAQPLSLRKGFPEITDRGSAPQRIRGLRAGRETVEVLPECVHARTLPNGNALFNAIRCFTFR